MKVETKAVLDSAVEVASQTGDFIVDSLCDNEVIQNIPVVGTFISLYKFGKSISDSIFLYKLRKFIDDLDSVTDSWKERFSDEKECRKIAQEVVFVINSIVDERKIKYYSKIFCKYVNDEISKDDLYISFDILHKSNYNLLKQIIYFDTKSEYDFMNLSDELRFSYYHFISLGLMEETPGLMEFGNRYRLNIFGVFFKSLFEVFPEEN